MRQSVQQETIRRVLAEMQDIISDMTMQLSFQNRLLEEKSNVLQTLVKTPSLPDFNGPKVEWIGERMIVK